MIGMCDVVVWSVRDETLHCQGLVKLFKIFIAENPRIVTEDFKSEIYKLVPYLIELEDAFIDRAFEIGAPQGITKDDTKTYARVVADYRMNQLGFKSQYNLKNPFQWLDWVLSETTNEGFFESNVAGYSKNSMLGSYSTGY